eukprot:SAG22_NODE_1913_length_3322_cov_2.699969_5_plen_56_part_00
MKQDEFVDEFINCRKSDVAISLPRTLGTESDAAQVCAASAAAASAAAASAAAAAA